MGKRKGKYVTTQKWYCKDCNRSFVARNVFKGRRYPQEVILTILHLRSRGQSLAQIRNSVSQHYGLEPADSTILDWIKKFGGRGKSKIGKKRDTAPKSLNQSVCTAGVPVKKGERSAGMRSWELIGEFPQWWERWTKQYAGLFKKGRKICWLGKREWSEGNRNFARLKYSASDLEALMHAPSGSQVKIRDREGPYRPVRTWVYEKRGLEWYRREDLERSGKLSLKGRWAGRKREPNGDTQIT